MSIRHHYCKRKILQVDMTYAGDENFPAEDPQHRNPKNDNQILKQHSLKK